jgi:hypothetical protein
VNPAKTRWESTQRISRIKLGQLLSAKKYLVRLLRKQLQEMIGVQKDLDLKQKEENIDNSSVPQPVELPRVLDSS